MTLATFDIFLKMGKIIINTSPASPRTDGNKNNTYDYQKDLSGRRLTRLSLAALGVIFGDIGTSPLYAIRECFHGEYGIAVTQGNVLEVLSLMLWSLLTIISFKYLTFIFRGDNHGEGGVIVLTALLKSRDAKRKNARRTLNKKHQLWCIPLLRKETSFTTSCNQ